MTIEELKAAREQMKSFGWLASCDGGDAETYQYFGDIAIALIDAEIERQSVTDAEIDEAENFVKAVASRKVEIDEELMKIFGESNRHWNLILDALRAYRKPESPDKAIRRILDERYKGSTKEERLANLERLKNRGREFEASPEVWRIVAEDLGLIEPIEPEP